MNDEQNAPTVVNDLSVPADEAKKVKGGAHVDYFLKLQGVDGDVTSATRPGTPHVSEIVVTKLTDGG